VARSSTEELTVVTREQALAASSPYLWVLAGQAVFLGAVVIGWNVWERREQLAGGAVRLLHL
jgi:hypothetical protein